MNITVNGQLLTVADDTLVSNSVGIYECEFTFDSSWDGFSKTSVWKLNSDDPIEVVISNGTAVIPHEVLVNAGFLRIGVYGTKDEKVMPTVWLETRKVCLGTPTGSIGTEPTPSIYAQILAVATNAENVANGVKTEWESVSATAETLPEGSSATASFDDGVFSFGIPQGQQGERGEQGEKGEQGETGNGIEEITATKTGLVTTFTIHFTDGTEYVFSLSDGVGISNITLNADYTLTIELTNGRSYTTTSIRGEKGDKGDQGDIGLTPDFSIGTVTTLQPNESATATITGTAEEPILNLGIPRGQTGTSDFASYLPIDSASGTIASFTDGAEDIPVEDLKVILEPIQSGSGDPSPTNIRPISGRNSVELVRTGANLVPNPNRVYTIYGVTATFLNNHLTVNGTATGSGGRNAMRSEYFSLKAGTYYFRKFNENGTATLYLQNNTTIISADSTGAFTLAEDSDKMNFGVNVANGTTYNYEVDLSISTKVLTSYEPYTADTYPISLGSTVYGGVLDVVSGELLDDWYLKTYTGNENFSNYATALVDSTTSPVGYAQSADYIICSHGTYANGIRFSNSAKNSLQFIKTFFGVSDDTEFKALLTEWYNNGTPLQVCYKLATPTTIQLTPTEVTTLLGDNNIWADSGTVEVTYRADIQGYIDKKISALATL